MTNLGYHYSGVDEARLVRSTDRNLPLYYLAFFSRHALGAKFWKEAKKYTTDQPSLF